MTGKAGKWYRVALAGGKVGFVFATLLGEEQPQAAALSKASAPQVAVGVFEKTYRSGDTFKDCPKCPQMVVVPEGSFRMGDLSGGGNKNEKPVHSVRIPRPFAVGVYEVTFAEWDACVGAGRCGGYRPNDFGWGRGNRPVINVSWDDAQAYVSWLSRKTGEEYRLLSEAEWEYAARAGSANQYHFGSSESDLCRYGNGGDRTTASMLRTTSNKSCSDGFSWTAPVGSFAANAFGLHDAHGNVDEWVEDCWRDSYAGAPTDGSKWTSGGDCARSVRRGGSWADRPGTLRSASRRWGSVGDRNGSIFGFRIARTLD